MSSSGEPASGSITPEGNALPNDLAAWVWERFQAHRASAPDWYSTKWLADSQCQLAELVGSAYQASLHTEEGRPTRFELLFDSGPQQLTFEFDEPLDLSVSELVKLAPTVGLGTRMIVAAPEDRRRKRRNPIKIFGILDPSLPPHGSPRAQDEYSLHSALMNSWGRGVTHGVPDFAGTKVLVLDPGHVRIDLPGEFDSFELDRGLLRNPLWMDWLDPVNEWYQEVGKDLAGCEGQVSGIASGLVRRAWNGILSRACSRRHGGCFLLLPQGFALDHLLRCGKYCSKAPSDILRRALCERLSLEPKLCGYAPGGVERLRTLSETGLLQSALPGCAPDLVEITPEQLHRAHFAERDISRAVDLISSCASVDGAVVMGRNLTMAGFGAQIITPGDCVQPKEVPYLSVPIDGGEPRVVKRSFEEVGGMRHRSAISFCGKDRGAMAFVVSQDGALTLFYTRRGKVTGVTIAADWPAF